MTEAKNEIMKHRKCGPWWKPALYYCCPEPGNKLPNNRTCGKSPAVYRIKGGRNVGLNELPWMALLLYRNRKSWQAPLVGACGGSLITNRYVLTAAHCVVKGPKLPQDLEIQRVRLGEHDTSVNPDCQYLYPGSGKRHCAPRHLEIDVEKVIPHQGYLDSEVFHYDIALLRLEIPVRYTPAIKPICVLQDSISLMNSKFKVAGWGKTESGLSSTVLLQATLKKLDAESCIKAYPYLEFNSSIQICVAVLDGIDTCHGDSGGPLMATKGQSYQEFEFVAGITSFGGPVCGVKKYPSVYTQAGVFFKWIRNNLRA
ncbi:serine protease easter [Drosophila rhopaloa]|uniref:Peptidase S1 domain-containing protein n=2 Tax=Drosophila rhopaloa TaxID=1041015 RepID=A0ABM5H983_DRORH|nr:serine protease easter [Drosophila rhopaloa]